MVLKQVVSIARVVSYFKQGAVQRGHQDGILTVLHRPVDLSSIVDVLEMRTTSSPGKLVRPGVGLELVVTGQ